MAGSPLGNLPKHMLGPSLAQAVCEARLGISVLVFDEADVDRLRAVIDTIVGAVVAHVEDTQLARNACRLVERVIRRVSLQLNQ